MARRSSLGDAAFVLTTARAGRVPHIGLKARRRVLRYASRSLNAKMGVPGWLAAEASFAVRQNGEIPTKPESENARRVA